ncbi:MAG TPA: hypothetical protein PLF08_06405 [Bacillota bacterium]|nr:hypothetical protein [Bacillota bacterium]HPZ78731.1 hypothetical protein [Bacillota bacterium]HQD74803.1 hypothetical protein [Bacillota bacterium]
MGNRFTSKIVTFTLVLLLLSLPSRAVAAGSYKYYYEGIVDTRTEKIPKGYYMGCVSQDNRSDKATGTIQYMQTTTKTVQCSVSGSLRYQTDVDVSARAALSREQNFSCATSVTISAGTTKGVEYDIPTQSGARIEAYVYKGKCTGKEKVRVEYYAGCGGGDPPVFNGMSEDPIVGMNSSPTNVWYEYNAFTSCYPSINEIHYVYTTWPLPN